MVVKPVLGATVGLQSVALLGEGYKMVPKQMWGLKAKPRPKKLVKGFTKIMIGTSLIRPTSSMVNALP